MLMFLYLLVSFLASVAGAICGIGGGVIIKPVLDMAGLANVSTISFLSGCTVLSMSCYSVGRNLISGESRVDFKTGTPLAMGAAIGGIAGNQLFKVIKGAFENQNMVGSVQAVCLALITVATIVYAVFTHRIHTHHVSKALLCVLIGLTLGIMSSFLGIGGGPINLMVLSFFFSMDTKTAAQNSLYIILFSQTASLITTLITQSVPEFEWLALVLMVIGGIAGGAAGRVFYRKMNNRAVDKLYMVLMCIIVCISIYNAVRYAM